LNKSTRKSVIAGAWYPGNPDKLESEIKRFFSNVSIDKINGTVIGLVSPHAGYMYSGQVAAHPYKLVVGKAFDTVIIIGPSHRSYFQGASIYNKGGYETPLGIVPVNAGLANEIIAQSNMISYVSAAHSQEHSVEIQLPFLQVALGSFNFVPVVMGTQDKKTCENLAEAIFKVIKGKSILLVASSDLSHFHGYDTALSMDSVVMKHIEKMDAEGLLHDLEKGKCEACGGGPIVVTIMLAGKLEADGVKVLEYANSGDITGDKSGVVGYTSAIFYKTNQWREKKTGIESGLGKKDKKMLLRVARESIQYGLAKKDIPELKMDSDVLQLKKGAFVTLKKHGQLRGCIGSFEAGGPLYETVENMARSAAFDDPRFPRVTGEELGDLKIEISVLTPLRKIKDINEIEVGKHGIYIVKGFRRGVLLPQVATDYKWDKITFLEETCQKAGLPFNAWKERDAEIYIFSADIFAENE
jgi:hypothetical protein